MPSTQIEIAGRLARLADDIANIAVDMSYYGGFAEWAKHYKELFNAAAVCEQWSKEITNDQSA